MVIFLVSKKIGFLTIKYMDNKWNNPIYHANECMRQLIAAEEHLIQYIEKDSEPKLSQILTRIRDIRKKIENDIFGIEKV